MTNSITFSPPGLVLAADKAAFGAAANAATIQLHHNGAAKITAERDALQAAIVSLEQGRDTTRLRRTTLQNAVKAAMAFLTLARDVLKPQLGKRHTSAWSITGFASSLAIPRNAERLMQVLELFAQFLGDNPEMEQEALSVTAAAAEAHLTAILTAYNAVLAQKSTVKSLGTARTTAVNLLRKTLINLKGELTTLIGNDDPRWLEFGFNIPNMVERPEAPTGVLAVLIGPTAVSVKWNAAPRAQYYRVWLKVAGDENGFVHMGSPADLDYILEGLPANSTVEIKVSAVNSGGESAASEVATVALM